MGEEHFDTAYSWQYLKVAKAVLLKKLRSKRLLTKLR